MASCIHCYHVSDIDDRHIRWVCWRWKDAPRQCFPEITCRLCEHATTIPPVATSDQPEKQRRRAILRLAARMQHRSERIISHPCCDSGKPSTGAFSSSERKWLDKLGIGR